MNLKLKQKGSPTKEKIRKKSFFYKLKSDRSAHKNTKSNKKVPHKVSEKDETKNKKLS
jgi:hypothetical protein